MSYYDLLEYCLLLYNIFSCYVKGKLFFLVSFLVFFSFLVFENVKFFVWVGDEILLCEMVKVFKFYMYVYFVYVFDLKKIDVNMFLYFCLSFLFLILWCKVVILYGKVLEFMKVKYLSLKNI